MEEWVKAQFVGISKWGRIKNGMFINCIPLRNLHCKQKKKRGKTRKNLRWRRRQRKIIKFSSIYNLSQDHCRYYVVPIECQRIYDNWSISTDGVVRTYVLFQLWYRMHCVEVNRPTKGPDPNRTMKLPVHSSQAAAIMAAVAKLKMLKAISRVIAFNHICWINNFPKARRKWQPKGGKTYTSHLYAINFNIHLRLLR